MKKYKENHFLLIKEKKIYQEKLLFWTFMLQMQGHPHFKRNFTKAQSPHCTSHNNSGRLQHTIFINGQIVETEIKQGHSETKKLWNKWT